jgi:hypothetical protein
VFASTSVLVLCIYGHCQLSGQSSGKNPGTIHYFDRDKQIGGSTLPKNTLYILGSRGIDRESQLTTGWDEISIIAFPVFVFQISGGTWQTGKHINTGNGINIV